MQSQNTTEATSVITFLIIINIANIIENPVAYDDGDVADHPNIPLPYPPPPTPHPRPAYCGYAWLDWLERLAGSSHNSKGGAKTSSVTGLFKFDEGVNPIKRLCLKRELRHCVNSIKIIYSSLLLTKVRNSGLIQCF